MDEILKNLYNNCHPLYAAQPKQYVDFTEARGGGIFIRKVCEELDSSSGYIVALFTGHQGCGKSSELKHLAHELYTLHPKRQHERYFPVYVDVEEYVDKNDASVPEIFLALVAEIAQELREKGGIELSDSYFQRRWTDIQRLLNSEVSPEELEFPLWQAKVKIKLKQADHSTREKVRDQLLPQMTGLIDEVNRVLIEARTKLRSHAPKDGGPVYRDIVLIIDNLEKILRVSGRETGEDSERALFIKSAEQFTSLQAHTIYTVTLRLTRAAGTELALAYGADPFVLPNVKTEMRGTHARFEPGRMKLLEMIHKRIEPLRLEQVFTSEALDFLLDNCGGHVRQLIVFVRQATLYADAVPIPLKAAQNAIRQAIPGLSTSVPARQWPMLAELELSPDQTWDNNDEERRGLLESLHVLEYVNGGEEESVYDSADPWYAVHPIVRELRQFKSAMNALKKTIIP